PVGFGRPPFGEQASRSGVIDLRYRADIPEVCEEVARAVEMFVRLLVASDREMQITEVVLNSCLPPLVVRLFVMETCRGVLNQSAIQIVFAIFWSRQPPQ